MLKIGGLYRTRTRGMDENPFNKCQIGYLTHIHITFTEATCKCVVNHSSLWNSYIDESIEALLPFCGVSPCLRDTVFQSVSEKNRLFAYAKTKPQISCAVTAQLISAFVFA